MNGYTRFNDSGPDVCVDYEAVPMVMRAVRDRFSGKRIGYPKIGVGLAKGDWSIVAAIIDDVLEHEDHTLVELAP